MNRNRKYSSLSGLAISRHDSERPNMSSDEDDDAFADILYDENKGASVQRTLEWLKQGYTKHEKALQALLLAQDGHCESMTAAMDEIGDFIERESSLTSSIGKHLLEVSTTRAATQAQRKPSLNRTNTEAPVPPVQQEQLKDVLRNFKAEIVRQDETHNKRCETLEQALAALRESVTSRAAPAVTEHVVVPPTHVTDEVLESKLKELKNDLQHFCVGELVKHNSGHTDAQSGLEQVQAEMVKDYAKRQAQILKDVDERNAANYKLFDNLLVIRLDSIDEKFEAKALQTQSKMEAIAQSFHALVQSSDAQAREVKLLRQQVEEMRQRERESVRRVEAELQSRVELIEQQMRSLREQVDNQNMLLEELHVQASFESSFREVRDWVGDLEKRAVNRGEIIEIVGRLDGEIAGLREEMALAALRNIQQPKRQIEPQ